MVLLQKELYFPKDPEGVKYFPGGGGGGGRIFPAMGSSKW